MIKAVLFDFNGVLLQDRKWHEQAWNELSKYLRNKEITQSEFEQHIHGRTAQDTLNFLLNNKASEEEKRSYLKRKEGLYQKIALKDKANFKLTQGATELFGLLEKNKIKKTIATSSPLVNVKFYYMHLALAKWFPFKDIVFDDRTFSGKPAPDIYLKAANKLHVDINNCVVIEDAKSGVESAQKAGAGKIIFLVNKDNEETAKRVKVYKVVRNFNDLKLKDLGVT